MKTLLAKLIIIISVVVCLMGCAKEDIDNDMVTKEGKEDLMENCDKDILRQVTNIMKESQKGRYHLENCSILLLEKSSDGEYIIKRMVFAADWVRVRKPEENPLIKGMYQALNELETEEEKETAKDVIDGYILEMNSEPETERIETNIVVKIATDKNEYELFYPYVYEGEETLFPLQEYAEDNWSENFEEQFQKGKDIIHKSLNKD